MKQVRISKRKSAKRIISLYIFLNKEKYIPFQIIFRLSVCQLECLVASFPGPFSFPNQTERRENQETRSILVGNNAWW